MLAILVLIFAMTAICGNETVMTAPPFKTPPTLDGIINTTEWQNAVKLSGGGLKDKQDSRQLEVWLGYDPDNFYFAIRSELPPGGQLLTKARIGEDIQNDDAVEFIILPPEGRQPGTFQYGYFQYFLNSEGFSWGMHNEPGWGLSADEWKPNIVQKQRLTKDGFWEMELAIPSKDFGWAKIPIPSQWRFVISRNFKYPSSYAAITPIERFSDKESMAIFNCVEQTPIVQMSYPDWNKNGGQKTELAIFNPDKSPITVSARIDYQSGDAKDQKITIPAGERKLLTVELANKKPTEYSVLAQVKKDDQLIFRRNAAFASRPAKNWNNLESALLFSQQFKNKIEEADFSAVKLPDGTIAGTPELRKPDNNKSPYVYLPNGSQINYNPRNLTVPGALFLKVRPQTQITGNMQRIYWRTGFKPEGHIFLYENNNILFLRMQYFPWQKNEGENSPNSMIIYHKPANGITGWQNIIINFNSDKLSMYINGVLIGSLNFTGPLDIKKLGEIILGSSDKRYENNFDVAELKTFNRTLTSDEISMMGLGTNGFAGRISYFPSLSELIVEAEANPYQLPRNPQVSLVVNDSNQNIIKQVKYDIAKDFKRISRGNIMLRQRVALPELKDGEYFCYLKVQSVEDGVDTAFLGRLFKVKKYDWLNNQIGLSRRILLPFTPLQVQGNTVSALLKDYKIGENGFPEKIIAKGEQILAEPIRCTNIAGGKELAWTHSGTRFTEIADDSVKYVTESENEMLKMKVNGEFDYDGLLKLTLNISPKNLHTEIEQFYIDLPIKKSIAQLFHAAGNGNRSNPAGYIPDGIGRVWGCRSLPHALENFVPYVWVGGAEKGLCYAADWDKDWLHSSIKTDNSVELIRRKDGTVSIRLNIFNNAPLKRDREIVISLLATPIKPMPEGWRGWSDNYSSFKIPGNRFLQCLYTPYYYGGYQTEIGRYPAFYDYEVIRKLDETRRTGKIDEVFLKNYLKRISEAPIEDVPLRKNGMKHLEIGLRCGFNQMKALSGQDAKNTVAYFYSCNYMSAGTIPELKVFKDEWEYRRQAHIVKSFRDFSVYYFAKMLESGMDGIYLDNSALSAKWTWPTGDGYIDDNGNIKPSFGLWRMRSYVKRLATTFVELGKEPFIYVHTTNSLYLPAFSFATASMDLEWKYNDSEFQTRYPADYFLTMDTGRQGGFFPTCIDGIVAAPEKRPWLTRTMLACFLPHEIQPTIWIGAGTDIPTYQKLAGIIWEFGKNAPDTTFIPYWDEATPVKPTSGNLIPSAYLRGNKMLLVIGNYGGDGDVTINIDCGKIGFAAVMEAVNCETGAKLSVKDNSLVLPILKHDIALIEISLRK